MIKACVICGNEFDAHHGLVLTCSSLCNKERVAAYAKTYYAANKERVAAYAKTYYAANKERVAARERAYRTANKERIAARERAFRAANKERIAARVKAWHAANKERVAAWRAANKERLSERAKRRIENNPERVAAGDRRAHHKRRLAFSVARKIAPSIFNNAASSQQQTAAVRFCKRFGLDLKEAVR